MPRNVTTGFASPADDYLEGKLSLDTLLIHDRDSTFFFRAEGDSMVGAGIYEGDLLVVDRSLTPASGSIVIAVVDGILTVRRLIQKKTVVILKPENPAYQDIEFKDGQELQVWGVVTSTIKSFARELRPCP
jgi:DNA polymerase V